MLHLPNIYIFFFLQDLQFYMQQIEIYTVHPFCKIGVFTVFFNTIYKRYIRHTSMYTIWALRAKLLLGPVNLPVAVV